MNDSAGELLCDVFRSEKRAGTYVFVDHDEGFSRMPEALLDSFGEPAHVLTMKLFPGRRLARADADAVLEAIHTQGFYLQMPPADPLFGDAAGDAPNAGPGGGDKGC